MYYLIMLDAGCSTSFAVCIKSIRLVNVRELRVVTMRSSFKPGQHFGLGSCLYEPIYSYMLPRCMVFPAFACRLKLMCLMQANFEVSQVVLTNRQECCRCPLAGANIYIGNPSNLNVIAVDNPDLSKESTWQLCATVRPLQLASSLRMSSSPLSSVLSRPCLAKASCAPFAVCDIPFAAYGCLSPIYLL